ncbi:MAG TPA: cyclic nucleotide-binding domain-containing protein, partial [Eudoraea sp.]|nr:cyclic nucleotide-binding domain-containing protein [Eudoraea sp.]
MSEIKDKLPALLAEVPFFSEVSRTSLSNLCKNIDVLNFERNDTIFKKGDKGEAMYAILDGKVKVHEDEHQFGFLSQGDCFGEYALIDRQERSASVTALEDTRVARIDRKLFLDLMKEDRGFAQGMLSVMIKRHRELDTIQERLASSKKELEIAYSKMSGLINGAMDAIIMFDSNFRIILTNP